MFTSKSPCLLLLILISMAGASACNSNHPVAATPTPDQSANVREFMGKYNQCFAQMDANCIATLYTPDGEIYTTGLLQASGPDKIRSFMDQSFKAAPINSFTATIDSIIINGDVGVVRGTYDEKTTNATGQSNEAKMQYTAEWNQQPNGQWLLKRYSTDILP